MGFIGFWFFGVKVGFEQRHNAMGFGYFTDFKLLE